MIRLLLLAIACALAPLAAAPAAHAQYYRSYYYPRYYYPKVYYPPVTYAAPTYVAPTVIKETPIANHNHDNRVAYSYTYNISYSQLPTAQGSTVYGYPGVQQQSYSNVADIYQNTDLGALYEQAIRMTTNAQDYTAQALAGTQNLLRTQGENQVRVAEIVAKGQAVSQIIASSAQLAAASGAAGGHAAQTQIEQNIQVGAGGGGVGHPPVDYVERPPGGVGPPSPDGARLAAQVQQLFNAKCVDCHSASNMMGGLDLSDLHKVGKEQARKVAARVIDLNPARRMPLAADGGPGEPLSVDEVRLIMSATRF